MRRALASVSLLALLVAGCGGGSDEPSSDATGATEPATAAAEVPDDICAAIPADVIGEALGAEVTAEAVPGGGCSYGQEDPRATSASVSLVPITDQNGGYDAVLTGARGVLTEVEETPVDGLGDGAVVLTGLITGLDSRSTTGLAQLEGVAVLVQVLGGDHAAQVGQAEAALRAAVGALG